MAGIDVLVLVVKWMLSTSLSVRAPADELLAHCRELARIRLVYRWAENRAHPIDMGIARAGRLYYQCSMEYSHAYLRMLLGLMRAAVLIHGEIFGLEIPPLMHRFGEYDVDAVVAEMNRSVPRMRAAALAIRQAEIDEAANAENAANVENVADDVSVATAGRSTQVPEHGDGVESFSDRVAD
jgi:hypothetical protein